MSGSIILAATIGVVVAFATITVPEHHRAALHPPATAGPIGRGPVASLPLARKLLVAAGWLRGALTGVCAAARIVRRPAIGWVPAGRVVVAGSPKSR